MTTLARPSAQTTRSGVVAEAAAAWRCLGQTCRTDTIASGPGLLGGIELDDIVEFAVATDATDAVWHELLSRAEAEPERSVGALVPLRLLGRAHEELRGTSVHLQGWWLAAGRVVFGAVELA